MRYKVNFHQFNGVDHVEASRHNLTLSQAWRLVERSARRGFNRHGGELARSNWGARGGRFPFAYHTASITLDQWR